MVNADSLEEICYSDQVFETFPQQANTLYCRDGDL